MKHNIYEFSLFLKILCFIFKGSLNIPEYRWLLIGRVQYLYTIEHAVGNITYHRFQSISVTLLSLVMPEFPYNKQICSTLSVKFMAFTISKELAYMITLYTITSLIRSYKILGLDRNNSFNYICLILYFWFKEENKFRVFSRSFRWGYLSPYKF